MSWNFRCEARCWQEEMSSASRHENDFKELPAGLRVVSDFGTFTVLKGLAIGR